MPSFTASGCRIPLDIVELITQQLAYDVDMSSLKASSLVCKDFIGICRKHIFHRIELSDSPPSWREWASIDRFKKLLDRNPKIANHIRCLKYHSRFDHKYGLPVLRRLHRVESFLLGFPSDDEYVYRQQEWCKLSLSLRNSLFMFLRSNSIIELRLINIMNLPMYIFGHLPSLVMLSISGVSIDDAMPFSSKIVPKLNSLYVDTGCIQAMRTLLAPHTTPIIDLACLQDFGMTLGDHERGMDVIRNVLTNSGKLASLTLSGCDPELDCSHNLGRYFTHGSLQRLKTIKLLPMLDTILNDPYSHLTGELEEIAGKNVLEELIFEISVETDHACTVEPSQWADLDIVLSQPDAFPYLRRVELRIELHWYSRDYTELEARLWDIGWKEFPWLTSNRAVEFTFSVDSEEVI